MIYKDLFKITVDGEPYVLKSTYLPKELFTLNEMKNIYLENLGRRIEIEYVPIMVDEILEDSEIYDKGGNE